jgi:hypothetical protein
MARMLAESLPSIIEKMDPGTASSSPLGWLAFLILIIGCAAVTPGLVWLIRRQLPASARRPIALEPVAFGSSAKSLRSPRQAVLQHRTLITTALFCVLAVLVLPGVSVIRTLGLSALQVAIGLVLPTFVVALHAHRRESSR